MNKKKIKQIDSFKVITDSGKLNTVYAYQEFYIAEEFGQAPKEIPGIISYRTRDGKGVNQIDQNTYQLLDGVEVVIAKKI
jgi:hypothetical protein